MKKFIVICLVLGLMVSLFAVTPAMAKPKYPNIQKAIHVLEMAKGDLQKAAHDFGGHRADALAACDKAIEQLKLALQYKEAGK